MNEQETKTFPSNLLKELELLKKILEEHGSAEKGSEETEIHETEGSSEVKETFREESSEITIHVENLVKEVTAALKEIDSLLIDNFRAVLKSFLSMLVYLNKEVEGTHIQKLILLLAEVQTGLDSRK